MPKSDNDKEISYACWKNSERISIHASRFQKHIATFTLIDSDENPPQHTVVIEVDIRHVSKQKKNKNNNMMKVRFKQKILLISETRLCSMLNAETVI